MWMMLLYLHVNLNAADYDLFYIICTWLPVCNCLSLTFRSWDLPSLMAILKLTFLQGSHSLENYLKQRIFLEKSFKMKSTLICAGKPL